MNNNQKGTNLSLFDMEKENQNSTRLDVVKAIFTDADTLSIDELFSGFDELYAITYSSSIGFVSQILDKFSYSEIIFGNEDIMSYSLQQVMAFQSKTIERLREEGSKSKGNLLTKIDDNTLKLYVANKKLSHEKIFILKAKDSKVRVITGSANMSYAAFSGKQRENIIVFEDENAYKWYKDCFSTLKDTSTDSISKKAIEIGDLEENLDALPISETIRVQKSMILETDQSLEESVRFAYDVRKQSDKKAPYMPRTDKKGKTLISPIDITQTKKRILEGKEKENEAIFKYPELRIDYDRSEVIINGKLASLSPSPEEITNDVDLFIEYMEGYRKFHGDFTGMQYKYYAFSVWFFTSPFIAKMRNVAHIYQQATMQYPAFGIVYGQSKAGKTTFLETLLKMMIGQKTKLSAPDFTRTSIDALRKTVFGTPIIVDDLTQIRFSTHGIETIKNDDFGLIDQLDNYPVVVISANEDIKAIAPEVVRRAVISNVKAGLKNTEVIKTNLVRKVQKNIGTAFYREFLRRMLEIIPDMVRDMKDEESESGPDIIERASEVLFSIINEYATVEVPEYIRKINIEDFFHERTTGSQVIKKIKEAWRVDQKAFHVEKKMGLLKYNTGATYEADRILKELPEDLEASKSGSLVFMNLDKASDFFEIDFKRESGLAGRLGKFLSG